MKLTPSQAKALSTERHLAITANAGSGKTKILVDRYIKLFEDRPDLHVRNVVAITFTENAAAELRERILKATKEKIEGLTRNDDKRHRLLKLRDNIPSAFIHTIHGFANRILRLYPVEANVDAAFVMLIGADQRIQVEDTISRVFYSELTEAYEKLDNGEETPIMHLFRELGRGNVTSLVRALLQNRARCKKITDSLLSKPNDVILHEWRRELERLLAYCGDVSTDSLLHDVAGFVKTGKLGLEALPYFTAYFGAETLYDKITTFAALADKIVTEKGALHSQRIDLKTMPESLLEHASLFITQFEALEPLLKSCPPTIEEFQNEHQEYLRLLRAAFALYDLVTREYETTKKSYGFLDFDDLISGLGKLLADTRVCSELVEQFRFVMIDEYQDTDESQYELARLLTENFGTRNNLTIVGDPKQSIYTFRNADASVFQLTECAIRAQTLSERAAEESLGMSLTIKEERGEIALRESFRMSPAPLATINKLFTSIMEAAGDLPFLSEGPAYSDLVLGRASDMRGSVEWICPAAPTRARGDEDIVEEDAEDASEAELIALKIRQMVQTQNSYTIEDRAGTMRTARYEDIAILLRSRSGLPRLEKALREGGIPYTVAKGAGFYSQQEILDISGYLSFLLSPTNDIALAGILRSPFFALSDVDLYQISFFPSQHRAEGSREWTLLNKLEQYCTANPKPHLLRALEQIGANRVLAGRTGAAYLVEKIYAETGIFATLSAAPNGLQKVANLEKFLAQARQSDTSGFSGLDDFVSRIQYLIEEEEKESQAEFSVEAGVVQILTVHAAKGLEYPIVILPFLQKKFMFDSKNILDKEYGLHLSLPNSERAPFIAELIRLRSRESTIAEEKRIFYVATTRAKDHLILSSTLPKQPQKNTWLEWVAEALPGAFEADTTAILLEEKILRYDKDARDAIEEDIQLSIPLIRSAEDIPIATQDIEVPIEKPFGPFHLAALPVLHRTGRFSATQFLRFKECPTKYYLSYVLGMPEEPKLAFDLEPAELSEKVRGDVLGQIVHQMMESIGQSALPNAENRADKLNHILFDLKISDEKERARYSELANAHLERFLSSDLAAHVLSSKEYHSEYSLQAQIATGDILFGIIDRLFRDAAGTWTILDYKTERGIDPAQTANSLTRYEFQLQFYAYLVHLMYPNEARINAILFYTATGEQKEFRFDVTDFGTFESEIVELIREIRELNGVVELGEITRNMVHCSECNYYQSDVERCVVMDGVRADNTARS